MTPVLVLYVNPYDFTDESTGRQVQGLSIEYLDLEQDPTDHSQANRKGYQVFKDTLELDALSQFQQIPGLYNLSHRRTRDAKGKQVFRVSGGELVKGLDLAKLIPSKVASSNN